MDVDTMWQIKRATLQDWFGAVRVFSSSAWTDHLVGGASTFPQEIGERLHSRQLKMKQAKGDAEAAFGVQLSRSHRKRART